MAEDQESNANMTTKGGGGKRQIGSYPMDFYSAGSPWAVSRIKGAF